ncbi:MAG: hypothetical protein IPJ34_23025 [Myxococcales bacterium]|nr:hypothetical protein [Myxococcales bacterium]
MYKSIVLAAALGLGTAFGCQPASDELARIEREQSKAQLEVKEAEQAAADKSTAAQAAADEIVSGAKLDFEKARDDFSAVKLTDLAALDKKIADLEATAKDKTGMVKLGYDSSLAKIRERRARLALDIRAIGGTSLQGWDAMTLELDKDTRELAILIEQAPTLLLL